MAAFSTVWVCRCQAGYFEESQKDYECKDECDERFWSLFTYGTCTDRLEHVTGHCRRACGARIRVWTTVFIFVTFVAAVALVIFLLPIHIASCRTCLGSQKDRKLRKKKALYKEVVDYEKVGSIQSSTGGGAGTGAGSLQPIYSYPGNTSTMGRGGSYPYWAHYYYNQQ